MRPWPPELVQPAPPWARLDSLTRLGLCLLVVILFGVSGGMLWLVGYNYDGITGGPLTKIHPGTYLTVLLFGWTVIVAGRPVQRLVHLANKRPAGFLMMVLAGVMLLVMVVSRSPGTAGIVDTYLACGLVVLLSPTPTTGCSPGSSASFT